MMETQARIPESAICRQCRYTLHSLPANVCPECGSEFDPRFPESYDDPADPTRSWVSEKRALWRLLVGRPGALLVAAMLLCIIWASNLDGSIYSWFKVWSETERIVAIAALVALEGCRFAIAAWVRRGLPPWLVPSLAGTAQRYVVAAIVVALCLIWAARPWRDAMAFYFSKTAIEKMILDAEQTHVPVRFQRIGKLHVRYIVHLRTPRRGAFVQLGASVEFGRYGFMYEPGVVELSTQVAPNWRIMNSHGRWR